MENGWQSSNPSASSSKPEQEMQSTIQCLEEWVCVLLIKNQRLRMASLDQAAESQCDNHFLDRASANRATNTF
jgi:hypothetical protein